jgi:hypothetical protein
MAYTPTTWTTGDTITATAMNKIENGIASGGGYDLIVECSYNVTNPNPVIVSGSILDCEDKLDNGEPVNAICIAKSEWSWTPSTANTNKEGCYLPLVFLSGPYCMMRFGGIYINGSTNRAVSLSIGYDKDTGSITNSQFSSVNL